MEKYNDSNIHEGLTLLGKSGIASQKNLECFPAPSDIKVLLTSAEIHAFCPLTKQPDFYQIRVSYLPNKKCIESKSFKLYLQSFANEGHFIEALCKIILEDLVAAADPLEMHISLTMNPRGGIGITAEAFYRKE